MPNTTDITGLPLALAVDGTEDFPLVQGGTTKRAKTGLIMAGSSGASVQDANTVFAGPVSGPAAAPSFRALVPADIPNGLPAGGDTGQQLVKLSDDDYDVGWVDDPAVPEPANTVLAGPVSGPDADPTFRSLVNGDLPTVDVSHGGSGRTSATAYAVLCGGTTATGAHQSVAGVGTLGQLLTSNGAGSLPTFQTAATAIGQPLTKTDDTNVTLTLGGTPSTALLSATSITAGWTGTLAATRGGTGFGSYTTGDVLYASSTSAFTRLNASTAGYLLQTNGAGTAPTWTGYLNPGASAVTRTWNAKASDFLSVKDFGAVGDGVTDDTAAITAAISAMPIIGGGLYFPSGRYLVSSVTFNKPGLYFGDGYASVIVTSSATLDVVTVSAEFAELTHLRFEASVTRSAGAYVYASGNRLTIRSFSMSGAAEGVRINVTATVTVGSGLILDSVAAIGIPVRVDNGLDVTINDILADQADQTYAGILITNCGDVTISDCNIIHCGQAIFVNPGSGKVVTSVWVTMCFFDNSIRGAYFFAQGGSIARCSFVKCWFSSSMNEGVRLETSGGGTINGVDFTASEFNLNVGHGVSIVDTGVTNIRLNGGVAAGNTGDGVHVAANVGSFAIANMRIGNAYGLGANANGIIVAAGTSDNYTIVDNDLRSNTGANLTDGGSGTSKVVRDNLPTTVNAALPVAQGGTGLTSGTSGGIPYFNSSTTMASSGTLTANAIIKGGGSGASPVASGVSIDGSNNITGVVGLTAESTTISKSQSTGTYFFATNTSASSGAEAGLLATNGTGAMHTGIYGTGTSYGAAAAGSALLYANATHITIMADSASKYINFAAGGTTESGRFQAGFSVGTTSDPGAGMIYTNAASFMIRTKTSYSNGAAAASATLTNAPASGNPTKWIPVDDNGTTRYIPAW